MVISDIHRAFHDISFHLTLCPYGHRSALAIRNMMMITINAMIIIYRTMIIIDNTMIILYKTMIIITGDSWAASGHSRPASTKQHHQAAAATTRNIQQAPSISQLATIRKHEIIKTKQQAAINKQQKRGRRQRRSHSVLR